MTIVPASIAEAPLLAALHAQCFSNGWDEKAFANLLKNDSALALLAHLDAENSSAGFILVQIAADESEILSLGVVPAHRRHGFATALIRAGAQAAQARGAVSLFLEVDVNNVAARALYRLLGFEEAGSRPGYYKTCDSLSDGLILRISLPIPAWESQFDSTSLAAEGAPES
jgi:[ribosomal protein S18]-alanine N-acetyltransferase